VVGHTDGADEVTRAAAEAGVGAPLLVGDGYEEALAGAPLDPSLDGGPGPELVFYTSGTTARPKGVQHGGLGDLAVRMAAMDGQAALWQWKPDDVYVLSGPAYHASHAGWGLTALHVGATTVILKRFDAREFLGAVDRHRATRSFLVPAHFIRILEVPDEERARFDLSTLRLVVHAAAPCPVAVKRRMMEAFPGTAIHELYGASEGGATRISPEEWLERPGSVGRPWPGVEVKVLDEEGKPVATGTDGIVWIKPPGGHKFTYRNDPEATERAWRGDAFTVGDIGHLDDDGYLTITDRVSDMVLWGGVNIAPREIEEVLYEHPAVVDCAVFGVPDERDGEHLKAMVEMRPDSGVGVDDLVAHVRSRLAEYKVPREWELVDELPRDPNGKVLKRLLRQQAQKG
jgi:long-chain acyl-CoA synthetase